MTRITNLAQHNQILANIRDTQSRLQETEIQMATGFKAQRYSGIAHDARQLVNLESSRARMEQYQTSNSTVNLRLQTMEISIGHVLESATQLKTLLTNALNLNNVVDMSLPQEAGNMLLEVARQLNVKIGDRYLFSGSKIDKPPVDLNAATFTAPPLTYPSVADTGYYQGDSVRLTARTADDFDLSYGVTADENGFEQIIRALNLTATTTLSPSIDRDRLQDALDTVNAAIANIPTIRSRIGASQNALDLANDVHADMTNYFDQQITNLTAVDITQAATKMSADQVLLQASYMTIAQIGQLSLASYLR